MINPLAKLRALFTRSATPTIPAPLDIPAPAIVDPTIDLPIDSDEPDYAELTPFEPALDDIISRDDEGRLHGSPARVYYHAGNNDVWENRTEYHHDHGKLVARVEIRSVRDEEGSSYWEEWFDADDRRHCDGGPALTVHSDHRIPEETYLDESRQEFWRHGEMVNSVDSTYEDIVSRKPLAVRQAFGYDIG